MDVAAALAELPVAELPAGAEGMAWLRSSVSRFANGEMHRRRRALAVDLLAGLDPQHLAAAAGEAMRTALAGAEELDAMPLARRVAVRVLAETLLGGRAPDSLVDDAVAVAAAYPPGSPESAEIDAALARLVAALGGEGDEAAARVALLAQACDATAALIGNRLLGETAPPVRLTKRVGPDGPVALDLEAAGLPFGAGPRACPGREQALAIAGAVVDAVREDADVVEDAPACERSPNLRIPARVLVRPRRRAAPAASAPTA